MCKSWRWAFGIINNRTTADFSRKGRATNQTTFLTQAVILNGYKTAWRAESQLCWLPGFGTYLKTLLLEDQWEERKRPLNPWERKCYKTATCDWNKSLLLERLVSKAIFPRKLQGTWTHMRVLQKAPGSRIKMQVYFGEKCLWNPHRVFSEMENGIQMFVLVHKFWTPRIEDCFKSLWKMSTIRYIMHEFQKFLVPKTKTWLLVPFSHKLLDTPLYLTTMLLKFFKEQGRD